MDWDGCTQGLDKVATLDCAYVVFLNIVNALLAFVGITAIILFIIGGYKFINSSGDAKRTEGARHTIVYAILGLLVVLFAFIIREIIYSVTGVACVKTFGFGC